MATTSIATISTERILLNPSDPRCLVVKGLLANDMAPGTWVYQTTSGTWDELDSDVAASKTGLIGVVGYEKRVRQSTGALVAITDNWDVSEPEDKNAPIIISGIVVALVDDQGASRAPGTGFMASTNAGYVTLNDLATAAWIATNASMIIDDDTVGIFGIGAFKANALWGELNAT